MFWNLENHLSERTALFEVRSGKSATYFELNDLIEDYSREVLSSRKLVFMAANNTIQCIGFYLACLRNSCPIFLFDPSASIHNLVERYKPDLLAYPDESRFVKQNVATPHLHQDLALLLSTSGSTGTPKFVKLSKENIASNARSIAEYLELDSTHKALGHLKPFYSYGLSVINSHLHVGATVYLTEDSATNKTFWDTISKYEISSFAGVPYTFQSLRPRGISLNEFPSLKYLTQAGGKLPPEEVKWWAKLCKSAQTRFIVMYGQTEASPRISYLPFEMIDRYPDSIGVAIPGGRLWIENDSGEEIKEEGIPGELCYDGPNVMMGYATSAGELADDKNTFMLKTGDIAVIQNHGIYKIVGRKSRFIKLLGTRINLDDIEIFATTNLELQDFACTGIDEHIVIASSDPNAKSSAHKIAEFIKIPDTFISFIQLESLPRLANGKIDYTRIKQMAMGENRNSRAESTNTSIKYLFSSAFIRSWFTECLHILGLTKNAETVSEIFARVFNLSEVDRNLTFKDYGGDSLKYVSATMEIERLLGKVPTDWENKSISYLERLRMAGDIQ